MRITGYLRFMTVLARLCGIGGIILFSTGLYAVILTDDKGLFGGQVMALAILLIVVALTLASHVDVSERKHFKRIVDENNSSAFNRAQDEYNTEAWNTNDWSEPPTIGGKRDP